MASAIMVAEREKGFKEMWEDAQQRFEQNTKRKLTAKTGTSLDNAVKTIQSRYDDEEVDADPAKAQTRQLIGNALVFIKLIGGIAAQGASVIFSPASMCFDAVESLINIPAKIDGFHDNIAELFRRINTFMESFQVYRRIEEYADVGEELKRGTQKVMICFVDIIGLAINRLDLANARRRDKFKLHAKLILFEDDSGVGAALNKFKEIIELQGQLSDAVTLEQVVKSGREINDSMTGLFDNLNSAAEQNAREFAKIQDGVTATHEDVKANYEETKNVKIGQKMLLKAESDRKSRSQKDKQIEEIAQKLGFKLGDVSGSEKELSQRSRTNVVNTGDWLQNIPEYKLWSDPNSQTASLLALYGDNKSGKSCLVSAIRDRLRSTYRTTDESSTRISIACYAFPGRDDKGIDKDTVQTLNALKSLAIQIAAQDIVYCKELSSHLATKQPSSFQDILPIDLLQDLQFSSSAKEATYFLLLDGLDQLPAEDSRRLLSALLSLNSPRVRIMITSTEDWVDRGLAVLRKDLDTIQNIDVEQNNASDIKQFIEKYIRSETLDGNVAEIQALITLMRENLPGLARGNFGRAGYIIENIQVALKDGQNPEDVAQRELNKITADSQDDASERIIAEYNSSLRQQEIAELNVMLMWSKSAEEWLSVEKIRAALYLKLKDYYESPVLPLEKKIESKYPKALKIDMDGDVLPRDGNLWDYLQYSKRVKPVVDADDDETPTISLTINIKRAKLSRVKRFFWDLSESMTFDKFPFENFAVDVDAKGSIAASPLEGNLNIAFGCFDLIFNDPKERTSILIPYATKHLMEHMRSLKNDAEELLASEKKELGANLVNLLTDPIIIEKHIESINLDAGWWLDIDCELATMWYWLNDSEAMAGLGSKDRRWVNQVISSKLGKVAVMEELARMIAKHWALERKVKAHAACSWINAYLDLLNDHAADSSSIVPGKASASVGSTDSTREQDMVDNTSVEKAELTSQARMERVQKWCQERLGITEKKSLWFERVGDTYFHWGDYELAMEAYQKVTSLPDCPRSVRRALALTYANQDQPDFEMAIQEMEAAIVQLKEIPSRTKDDAKDLAIGLGHIADWHGNSDRVGMAIEKFRAGIKTCPDHYYAHHRLLQLLVTHDRVAEAVDHLNRMINEPAGDATYDQFEELLLYHSSMDQSHPGFDVLFRATRNGEMFQVVLRTMRGVVDSIYNSEDPVAMAKVIALKFHLGIAFAQHSEYEERDVTALALWKACCKLGYQIRNRSDRTMEATYFVLNHHIAQALEARRTDGDPEPHILSAKDLFDKEVTVYDQELRLHYMLASYYSFAGEKDKMVQLLRNKVKEALELLDDKDESNDFQSFQLLVEVLLHANDDLNVLSAYSLLGPWDRGDYDEKTRSSDDIVNDNENGLQSLELTNGDSTDTTAQAKKERMGDMYDVCDGLCGKVWTYADDMYCCRFCTDRIFCKACVDKLQDGTLARYTCRPDHQWLHIPPWSDEEYRTVGKGRVRMGGELVDGKRVGGKVVTISEWRDSIRDAWGIEKPEEEAEDKE